MSTTVGNSVQEAPIQVEGRFRNAKVTPRPGFLKTMHIILRMLFSKPDDATPPRPVPTKPLTQKALLDAPINTLYRLGHSTILLKLSNGFWLTDPVFSERASPVQWAGPQRFHQPPISIRELPPIKGVILSHDHYDHLDYAAIQALADKVEHFLTPTGVGDTLVAWGVDTAKITQLSWWESTQVDGIEFTATPSQHFSGRGLFDGNRSLWASWVINAQDLRIFFSGDSGYFNGFKAIGDRFGPFDITLMETGAYDKDWPDVHMQPEETLQAHLDLQGKFLLPIHNGTFDLALHAWYEPFDRIVALAAQTAVPIATPRMGEAVNLCQPHTGESWWLDPEFEAMMAAQYLERQCSQQEIGSFAGVTDATKWPYKAS